MTISRASSLARYIYDDLFDWFMQERRNLLEDQMRRNDDAFRGRYESDSLTKWKSTEGQGWRSKVFVRLTKQKVVTAYSSLTAVQLQGGKLPWDLEPTEIPEDMPGSPMDEALAKAACLKMKKQIQDDFDECLLERRYASAIMELCLHGWSWIRGPVLRQKRVAQRQFVAPQTGFQLPPELIAQYGRNVMTVADVWKPVMEPVSVWNVFWDFENADHQAGHGVCIRDMMSYGRFLDLAESPGYDKSAVMAVIDQYRMEDEGTVDESHGPYMESLTKRKRVIPVIEFYGRVPKRYLEAYDKESLDLSTRASKDSKETEIHCVIAVGSKEPVVIRKPIVNPMPYRPVYRAVWEEVPYEASALGIPENMQDSQAMVNGLARSMMDNKALSSNLLIWWCGRNMAPGQNALLYPGKIFETADHVEDVRQAMQFFSPPDNTAGTPEIINIFERWADEETGLPKILQGETSKNQPDTAFEMSKLIEAANKAIGATIRNCDHGHISPLVTGFYDYHYITNPDESMKGDYVVKALGFASYQDKAIRGQNILGLAQFALSNQFTAKFVKTVEFLRELARIRDLDPDKYFMTDDELQQQAAMMMQAADQMAMGGMPGGGPAPDEVGGPQAAGPSFEGPAMAGEMV